MKRHIVTYDSPARFNGDQIIIGPNDVDFDERNKMICHISKQGWSLATIGRAFDVSAERIRQIVRRGDGLDVNG